jgi:hypothetical protein
VAPAPNKENYIRRYERLKMVEQKAAKEAKTWCVCLAPLVGAEEQRKHSQGLS